jgi:hypothetical protein
VLPVKKSIVIRACSISPASLSGKPMAAVRPAAPPRSTRGFVRVLASRRKRDSTAFKVGEIRSTKTGAIRIKLSLCPVFSADSQALWNARTLPLAWSSPLTPMASSSR